MSTIDEAGGRARAAVRAPAAAAPVIRRCAP